MKRNIAPSPGSSDEDKTSLKKAKKENSGKRKNTEKEITESIDGSLKRVTIWNGKVEALLPEVKGVCSANADDRKTVKNETGYNVSYKNCEGETERNSCEDIITEIELVSREAFTNGRYTDYSNSSSDEAEVEDILQESICSREETSDKEGSRREESMINDAEYRLLAEKLTGLFRDIYRDARARNREEKSISKCQVKSKIHGYVMKVSNVGKGESYLCNKTRIINEEKYNSSYACGEVSDTNNVAERSDEGLGKEASDYNSDNEVRNEHSDESNNLSFGENTPNFKRFRYVSSEKSDKNEWEKSNSSCSSEMNDEGLGKEISGNTDDEENGVQSGKTNRNRVEENRNPTEKADKFADCPSNVNPYEECTTSGTSDEESDSITDVTMSEEEGAGGSSSDEVQDKQCSDPTNDKKRMKCKLKNNTSSEEGDSSELNGESDMSTDEDSWCLENEISSDDESDNSSEEESGDDNTDETSDEETDSFGTEESDNSEEESDEDNTDQSSDEVSSNYGEENSDTSSGEDDSTDSEVSVGESDTSTDEDCSNESEDCNCSNESENDSEMIDKSVEEDKNSNNYGDETDLEWEDISPLSNEKRSKTRDITDGESSNSTYEKRNNSTDPAAYYRGARKENIHSGSVGPSGIHRNIYARFNYRSCKEIICSSTEEESSPDCVNEYTSSETDDDLKDIENIRKKTTPESTEVNNRNAEERKSRDDTGGLERLLDNVLGFLSYRRLSIATPGQDTISISVTQLKLMPLKDYFRESVDGRHKKRVVANRKGNIITPSIKGNFKDGKIGKTRRNMIKNKVSVENKAAEVSDVEEEKSDEEAEWQVKDRRDTKGRNKNGNKQIEYVSDLEENAAIDKDHDEEDDEDSSEEDGEDNGKGLEDAEENDAEDIGEEDSDEDCEEETDGGEHEESDEEVDEEENEYVELKDQGNEFDEEEEDEEYVEEEEECEDEECEEEEESEEEEDIEEGNELEDIEEEEEENVHAQVRTEDDSNEQSSENDDYPGNTKTKSRTMTKKKETKEQVRGKTNLMKKKK